MSPSVQVCTFRSEIFCGARGHLGVRVRGVWNGGPGQE